MNATDWARLGYESLVFVGPGTSCNSFIWKSSATIRRLGIRYGLTWHVLEFASKVLYPKTKQADFRPLLSVPPSPRLADSLQQDRQRLMPTTSAMPIGPELDSLFQCIVIPTAMDKKDDYKYDVEMFTPPHSPLTPLSLCLLSPFAGSGGGQTAPSQCLQQHLPNTEAPGTIVSLSTSFQPSARHCGDLVPDLVLLSADSVFFYVHSSVIRSASNNNLCGFLTENSVQGPQGTDQGIELVVLPDQSEVLNVMLHFIYNISPAHHSPPFDVLSQAVDRLHNAYGVDVNHAMRDSATTISRPRLNNDQTFNYAHDPSFLALLTAHAPLHPIEVYALAASIDLYPLTQTASLYLHGLDLCPTDAEDAIGGLRLIPEMGQKMGGVYLMRLIAMHKRRLEALRTAVCTAPEGHMLDHPSEDQCSTEDQASLKRAWALAAAYLVCTAGPGVSAQAIDGTFRPLAKHVSCSRCREALDQRLESINREWGMAPRTI